MKVEGGLVGKKADREWDEGVVVKITNIHIHVWNCQQIEKMWVYKLDCVKINNFVKYTVRRMGEKARHSDTSAPMYKCVHTHTQTYMHN